MNELLRAVTTYVVYLLVYFVGVNSWHSLT